MSRISRVDVSCPHYGVVPVGEFYPAEGIDQPTLWIMFHVVAVENFAGEVELSPFDTTHLDWCRRRNERPGNHAHEFTRHAAVVASLHAASGLDNPGTAYGIANAYQRLHKRALGRAPAVRQQARPPAA